MKASLTESRQRNATVLSVCLNISCLSDTLDHGCMQFSELIHVHVTVSAHYIVRKAQVFGINLYFYRAHAHKWVEHFFFRLVHPH